MQDVTDKRADEMVYFDVRTSVRGRNRVRYIIGLTCYPALIWVGTSLISKDAEFALSIEAIDTWNGWSFVGAVLVLIGLWSITKEIVFAFRAQGTSGEWHFRLDDQELLWHVPEHGFGKEEGFHVPLGAIKHVEFKTIEKHESIDEREYWVHFHAQDPIQLRGHSGVSRSWMVDKMREAGLHYEETRVTW